MHRGEYIYHHVSLPNGILLGCRDVLAKDPTRNPVASITTTCHTDGMIVVYIPTYPRSLFLAGALRWYTREYMLGCR